MRPPFSISGPAVYPESTEVRAYLIKRHRSHMLAGFRVSMTTGGKLLAMCWRLRHTNPSAGSTQ